MAASALSSLEAMLKTLMGMSGGAGGDDVLVDVNDELDSPLPPPLPARPSPRRRRRPSRPQRAAVVGTSRPWTPPLQSSSQLKEEEDDAEEKVAALVEELERKAAMAEARLRQKNEENDALHREMESYHVRWLQNEIKLHSLKETIDEQKASLKMAQESAVRSREMLSFDRHRHESSKSHIKMSEDTPAKLRQDCGGRACVVVRRNAVVTTARVAGEEIRRQSQALVVEPREPWQPVVPGGNSIDDLEKLKSQFSAWKKDYKVRLRNAAMAELDYWERRRRSSCWI